MAFIRHIAIASKDPAGTAEFYKQHFDLKELYRRPRTPATMASGSATATSISPS